MPPIENLIKNIIALVENRVELFKLDIKKEFSTLITKVFILLTLSLVGLLALLFSSFALCFLLNRLLESIYMGFVIVSFSYIILAFIILQMWKSEKIKVQITDFIYSFIFKEK
ncbi:phage holin family protein [Penaeicola halotolerans]|uniref:phage holin family protein n=1 Tax=Penaeicola halotolerans TaxID=2793196 RepID=UPI001CF80D2B|nr:phage holin family protein [Penaeicola halotolerans]